MALVLVKHEISGQVVEIDEIHLSHPVLGPLYKRVRRNAAGKVYAWNEKDPDTVEDQADTDEKVETKTSTKDEK